MHNWEEKSPKRFAIFALRNIRIIIVLVPMLMRMYLKRENISEIVYDVKNFDSSGLVGEHIVKIATQFTVSK